jgi:hypothetical protein
MVIDKAKMEDKANAAKASMQDELKHMIADHDKGLKEQMVEQSCSQSSSP